MLVSTVTRLRLKVVEYDKEVTMRLQMSKRSRKTTLGDLQGDQSKGQLSKSPSFIVLEGVSDLTEKHVAVHNYVVVCIKGEVRSAQADGRSSMWILRSISTRESFKGEYQ
jgi:hypothetical protein